MYQTIHCVSAQLEYLLYLLDGERLRALPARGILQTVHAWPPSHFRADGLLTCQGAVLTRKAILQQLFGQRNVTGAPSAGIF